MSRIGDAEERVTKMNYDKITCITLNAPRVSMFRCPSIPSHAFHAILSLPHAQMQET